MAKDYDTATAPYNFVSLPQGVLTSPIEGDAMSDAERVENYRAHVLAKGRLSGRIDLEIKTLTPVFIGTGVDAGNAVENFFAPTGIPIIPGSSLRGMIKNLFKIVTCSAMRAGEDYHDQVLYFRSVAGGALQSTYNKRVPREYTEAGYLIRTKTEQKYYICPTDYEPIYDKRAVLEYENRVFWNQPQSGFVTCYTGKIGNKKHYTVHQPCLWQERLPVSAEVIAAYQNDKARKGFNLLEDQKTSQAEWGDDAAAFTNDPEIDFVIPCFYQEENGSVLHFGFGRFYRISYRMSVSDHVIDVDVPVVDYADALFGRKELWASRLAFTDALPEEQPQMDTPDYLKILSSPKPTAVQLYLEQKHGRERLAHWDSKGVPIRGYKLYWHQKDDADWHGEKPKKEDEQRKIQQIQPVKKGTKFSGSIRFECLSEDELGALLKVLCLCDGHLLCKIGKGKPLGLGSIEIIPRLFLTDTEDSYHSAFDGEGGWNTAERRTEMNAYIQAFERELDRLGKDVRARYDKAQKELVHLLRWDHTKNPKWEEKIAQMTIGQGDRRFQGRAILPTALDVK